MKPQGASREGEKVFKEVQAVRSELAPSFQVFSLAAKMLKKDIFGKCRKKEQRAIDGVNRFFASLFNREALERGAKTLLSLLPEPR